MLFVWSSLAYCVYFSFAFYLLRLTSFLSFRPSMLFYYSTLLFCFPGFYIFYKDGENRVFGLGSFVLHAYELSFLLITLYIVAFTSCLISFSLLPDFYRNSLSSSLKKSFPLASVFFLLVWILNPYRLSYLHDLLEVSFFGSGLESQFMRRNVYVEGFYNTKVFSWLRFSVVPFCIFIVQSYLRNVLPLFCVFFISVVLFVLSITSFHKSSWILCVIFPFFLTLVNKNKVITRYKVFLILAPFLVLPPLLLVSYFLQYNDQGFDLIEMHFNISLERIFCATSSSLLAFISEFTTKQMPFSSVFLPMQDLDSSPEGIVGFLTGKSTTIQAGVLGSFFSVLGLYASFAYLVFALFFLLLSDYCYIRCKANGNFCLAACFLFPPVMILHNSFYPSLFSSGFFVLVTLFFCTVFFLKKK